MLDYPPAFTDILCGNRSTNGTILTIPAGKTWSGDISISGSIAIAGNDTCTVTVSGAGVSNPVSGSIIAQMTLAGVALTTVADNTYIEAIVAAPAGNSVDLVFSTGGMSTSTVVINGHTF